MTMLFGIRHIARGAMLAAVAVAATGCSLMHEDLDPCSIAPDTRTEVSFIYDYNTQMSDKFNDIVGAVTVYVFDTNGRLVAASERTNALTDGSLMNPNFKIEFDSVRVKPGHDYTFYAVAHANPGGYETLLNSQNAMFRHPEMLENSKYSDYILKLDRNDKDGMHVVDNKSSLDDTWVTLSEAPVMISPTPVPVEGEAQLPDRVYTATVPLMRVTNIVDVTVWREDWRTYIEPEQFDIYIDATSGIGTMDMKGTMLDDTSLHFEPVGYRVETRTIDGEETQCLVASFSLPRMLLNHEVSVTVNDKITEKTTVQSALPERLATGNEAYAGRNWKKQEYLDRENQFSILFPLGDPVPRWCDVEIKVLGWCKRVQNIVL